MSKIMIVEDIISINNEVTPGTYAAVDSLNTYTGDIANGYQDRSINHGANDPTDPITAYIETLKTPDDVHQFIDMITNPDKNPDYAKYAMTKWSSLQFAKFEQQIVTAFKDDKADIGTVMGEVQGIQNTFNSYTTEQLTIPQSLQKEVQGTITQVPTRIQVALDAANSVMSLIGLYANLPKN